MAGKEAQSKLRSEFLQLLRSRRPAQVPLTIELAKPVENPLYQNSPPTTEEIEILESTPKADIENLEELLEEENLYLNIEEGKQGRLPVLILKLKEGDKQRKRPAVVFLHSSYSTKEAVRPLLKAYASRGYIAISVDSRYHGKRAANKTTYRDALISAWKTGETMPFIYDTVWDLIKLADYLTQREDIDTSRIGITGVSLGGMHAWFAAAADTRYAVVVPVIGVQGFRWAIDNDEWQGRVGSIKPVFKVARDDLGKGAIDKEVVEKVWDRIAPGLASQFDSPYSIPTIAPRPLLILNGAEDPLTPLGGLETPRAKASHAYGEFHCLDNFKFIAEPGIGHQLTRFQLKESSDWFDRVRLQGLVCNSSLVILASRCDGSVSGVAVTGVKRERRNEKEMGEGERRKMKKEKRGEREIKDGEEKKHHCIRQSEIAAMVLYKSFR
ncbi:putative hydrolase YtaP [Spatholobus suberectus]|nr:putative hydrolase YtaP [Spatholobus suberectus]